MAKATARSLPSRQTHHWKYVESCSQVGGPQIDHAMNVGKRVFGALHPAIQDMAGHHVNRAVMEGISGYEKGRN